MNRCVYHGFFNTEVDDILNIDKSPLRSSITSRTLRHFRYTPLKRRQYFGRLISILSSKHRRQDPPIFSNANVSFLIHILRDKDSGMTSIYGHGRQLSASDIGKTAITKPMIKDRRVRCRNN